MKLFTSLLKGPSELSSEPTKLGDFSSRPKPAATPVASAPANTTQPSGYSPANAVDTFETVDAKRGAILLLDREGKEFRASSRKSHLSGRKPRPFIRREPES